MVERPLRVAARCEKTGDRAGEESEMKSYQKLKQFNYNGFFK
jgi:hypothetical protein